jgi:peptide/nickel transport system substrate-binding protein
MDAERDSMRTHVRIVAILAAVLTAVTLSVAAASGGGASGVKEGGTFRVAEAGLFSTIDPALVKFAPEGEILRPTCAGLVAFPNKPLPAGLRVEPDLAEALPSVSRNGKTYTFTIRKDARFSNGKPVTARDFVHALERILDPAMESSQVPYFEPVVGAQAMLEGKTKKLTGAIARGRTLILRLTRPVSDFLLLLAGSPPPLCAVPSTLPVDPEGAKAPLPSPAPYYVAQYVPGERVVLERNRFYLGPRPHHVDRFVVDLGVGVGPAFDRVLNGSADYALGPPTYFAENADGLARRYGVNKSQFFVVPSPGIRMFALNTSRPLFKANVKLRQAINFAVDRRALTRELGPYAGTATDQYLPSTMPGHVDARIYPLAGPDLRKARALAAGNRRSGKAVLYTLNDPINLAQGQILQQNLAKIGIEVEIQQFPIQLLFEKLSTPGEPFDIGRISWGGLVDPGFLGFLFDGRTIGQPESGNWSYFDSPKFNRMLDRAAKLPLGPERYRAYGQIDVQLTRDAAPAIPYGVPNQFSLVSSRVGCIVVNPSLDLTAVCLK